MVKSPHDQKSYDSFHWYPERNNVATLGNSPKIDVKINDSEKESIRKFNK